jgi:hypothetical protein
MEMKSTTTWTYGDVAPLHPSDEKGPHNVYTWLEEMAILGRSHFDDIITILLDQPHFRVPRLPDLVPFSPDIIYSGDADLDKTIHNQAMLKLKEQMDLQPGKLKRLFSFLYGNISKKSIGELQKCTTFTQSEPPTDFDESPADSFVPAWKAICDDCDTRSLLLQIIRTHATGHSGIQQCDRYDAHVHWSSITCPMGTSPNAFLTIFHHEYERWVSSDCEYNIMSTVLKNAEIKECFKLFRRRGAQRRNQKCQDCAKQRRKPMNTKPTMLTSRRSPSTGRVGGDSATAR